MNIVHTTTEDKLLLTGLFSEPANSKENIIVHIHGMAGDPYTNSWYPDFHKLFPEKNYAFLAGNHRGTGSITMFFRVPDEYPNYGNALEIFEECVHDIGAWVQFARDQGYKNIYISSHSFAPSKVLYYLHKTNPKDIKGLILISPVDMLGLTMHDEKSYKRLMQEARLLEEQGKEDSLLSELLDGEYYLSAKTYINLFSKDSNCNVFNYTGRENHDWSLVNKITQPVLAISGTDDTPIQAIVQPAKALEILRQELKSSSDVKTKVYDGAAHDFAGFEQQIVDDVTEFIDRID